MFGYGDTVKVIPYGQIGRIVGDTDRAGWLPVVLESESHKANPSVVWCKPEELS
jgi:alkylated DNA nucleotide flippase Atl1